MGTANRERKGRLPEPLVIVATSAPLLLLVSEKDVGNFEAEAQVYDVEAEKMVEEIRPIPIWLKFLYYVEEEAPPVPFTEHERRFRVEAYRAAKRAREKAQNG